MSKRLNIWANDEKYGHTLKYTDTRKYMDRHTTKYADRHTLKYTVTH